MWETRHSLVTPERGPGGQRLYTEADVELLRAARLLVGRGYAIGELAEWSREELIGASREAATPRTLRRDHVATTTDVRSDSLGVIVAIDREGVVSAVSPSVEALLGWPHALLVGQPIWGLLHGIPAALERLVAGDAPPKEGTICWVWLRCRSGTVIPCRFACGKVRRTSDGTTLTISITPLTPDGEARLSPLLENVDSGGLLRFAGSPEQVLKEYVGKCVDVHEAALARVWTYEPADGSLHLVASAGLSKAITSSPRSVIRLSGYPFKVGIVARTGIPYLHNGLDGDRDFERAWIRREKLESAAVLPLIADGVLLGVTAQFFRRRLGALDVGRLQTSAALCEAWLRDRTGKKPS